MGNTESNVTSGVKKQADTSSIQMYKLADLKGGGLLVELMKRAAQNKQYAELDHAIKTKVEPFLYNKGRGRLIPISQLVLLRNKDRPRHKMLPVLKAMDNPEEYDINKNMTPEPEKLDNIDMNKYRDVCWDLNERGAVGETILHLCLLNATSVHADLAKRLLRFYPKLINDIYMCDEYYGETTHQPPMICLLGENVLHIAIVNEDPSMVKFLLDSGANYHERCFGNFMCPEDQKASRTDSLDYEWVNLTPLTNYDGYVYWGEYPLSFAACLGQEECYRLILARGANPDNQDTNGNTVLHMLVIYEKLSTFDMAYEVGADLSIRNVLNLTPLTLAAKLARIEMFFHILNIEREIYWQIGSIACAAYPLTQIDTIDIETGTINRNSALNLVVFGEKDEHLELMDGVLIDLLNAKWNAFVKSRFYRQFFLFLLYFLISLICFTLRPGPPGHLKSSTNSSIPAANTTLLPSIQLSTPVNSTVTPPVKFNEPYRTNNKSKSIHITSFDDDLPFSPPVTESISIDHRGAVPVANTRTTKPNSLDIKALHMQKLKRGLQLVVNYLYKNTNESQNRTDRVMTSTMRKLDTEMENKIVSELNNSDLNLNINNVLQNLERFSQLLMNDTLNPNVTIGQVNLSVTKVPATKSQQVDNDDDDDDDDEWWEDLGDCRLLQTNTKHALVRLSAELALVIGANLYILAALREARFLGLQMFIENLMTAPSRVMFLFSCLLMMTMPFLRFLCHEEAEDMLAVVIMLTIAPYFLFFCRGFKTVGPFVVMIYRMLMGDLLRFVTIYLVFIMGFSQAYYIIFLSFDNPLTPDGVDDSVSNPMPNPIEAIMAMFFMSLTNFGDYYSAFERTEHDKEAKFCFVIYMAIVAILLVNMLIAMMGNTYQKIAETKNEWQRQWARIVLVVERGVSPSERLTKLMWYSQPMSDGRRALVLRLNQSEEDKEDMKEILEMKRVHNKIVEKRLRGKKLLSTSPSPKRLVDLTTPML